MERQEKGDKELFRTRFVDPFPDMLCLSASDTSSCVSVFHGTVKHPGAKGWRWQENRESDGNTPSVFLSRKMVWLSKPLCCSQKIFLFFCPHFQPWQSVHEWSKNVWCLCPINSLLSLFWSSMCFCTSCIFFCCRYFFQSLTIVEWRFYQGSASGLSIAKGYC